VVGVVLPGTVIVGSPRWKVREGLGGIGLSGSFGCGWHMPTFAQDDRSWGGKRQQGQQQKARRRKKQIPRGNDRKKGKGNGTSNGKERKKQIPRGNDRKKGRGKSGSKQVRSLRSE
jgi:hypothetical protein